VQDRSSAPVVAFRSLQNRDSEPPEGREPGNATAGQTTARYIDADRRDPVIPPSETGPMAGLRESEDAPGQIQYARAPPSPLPPRISAFEPPHPEDGALNKSTGPASDGVDPSVATPPAARARDTRQVRVWVRYFPDTVVGSQGPAIRVFAVEHERPRATAEGVPVETTAASAASDMREVRVRTTFRSSKSKAEMRIAPQVITVKRE